VDMPEPSSLDLSLSCTVARAESGIARSVERREYLKSSQIERSF
jgi:hypothetical protein